MTLAGIQAVADGDRTWHNQAGLRRADVPAGLLHSFNQLAEEQVHRQRALVHIWVVRAARVARYAGHKGSLSAVAWDLLVAAHRPLAPADLLPQPSTLPVLEGPRSRVKWLQGEHEYARCRELIEGAGSTVPAAVRAAMWLYVDAGGDLLAAPSIDS